MIVLMNEVPPYVPTQKKSKVGLIVGLIIGGVLLCCVLPIGLLGGGIYYLFGKGKDLIVCGEGFNSIQKAMLAYAKDHKNHLPKAATWMDDVRPYYRQLAQEQVGQQNPFGVMPADGVYSCTTDGIKTGIAFNKDLSGKAIDDIKDKEETVLLFETEAPAVNLSEKYVARDNATSPKMFGKRRNWFTISVEGRSHAGTMMISGTGNTVIVNGAPGVSSPEGKDTDIHGKNKPKVKGKDYPVDPSFD